MKLRSIDATRYVMPLREGGSLPALVEASDDGLYVAKFRGAGHGVKALTAEVIAGELARALGFRVPELVLLTVDPRLASAEPDEEIQDLLAASAGLNLGVDFLPGALSFNVAAEPATDPELAADIVWFDAFVTNVDRTPRNTNLLTWHADLWLIDHGASLFFHYAADAAATDPRMPFPMIAEHVLLPVAGSVSEADARLAPRITNAAIDGALEAVPVDWLDDGGVDRYRDYLVTRIAAPRDFVHEAERARDRR
ncbi:MAG TPA: HipA family kinase [Candidatus Limnocylindrales bacterium]|nr:HipA family kinase [Candidatus Limnocylindrales bacterium]